MTGTTSIGGAGTKSVATDRSKLPQQTDAFSSLQIEDFLKLMISELQNQDPLNPMDNNQILQQVGQMQSITSNTKLTATLGEVLLGQNLASGGGLIGKGVEGLTDDGDAVLGVVDSLSIKSGKAYLNVNDSESGKLFEVQLSNVRQVM